MFLPQRSLQTVTFLAILFFACFATPQDIGNRRAVTEHQLMHDKGRAFQGLKRLQWLHEALGTVHTAGSRAASPPSAAGDVPRGPGPSDRRKSIAADEASSLPGQPLGLAEGLGALPLQRLDLEPARGDRDTRGLPELLQSEELGSRRNPGTQPQGSSR